MRFGVSLTCTIYQTNSCWATGVLCTPMSDALLFNSASCFAIFHSMSLYNSVAFFGSVSSVLTFSSGLDFWRSALSYSCLLIIPLPDTLATRFISRGAWGGADGRMRFYSPWPVLDTEIPRDFIVMQKVLGWSYMILSIWFLHWRKMYDSKIQTRPMNVGLLVSLGAIDATHSSCMNGSCTPQFPELMEATSILASAFFLVIFSITPRTFQQINTASPWRL